ncbi:MAG: hypothetical protein NT154_42280 [Verrucomicrobia bacterium]|nr:hypothetical protein [Verrucomicrobiota bacterium]
MNRTNGLAVSSIRLAVGAGLDVILLLMLPRPAMWSSDDGACRMALVYAAMGAAAVVFVVPVIRRGTDLQRVGAVVVLVLSALAFWPAVDYWLRTNN